MNIGPIIDVAIGLIFVWITLSLSTIQVQEWISTLLNKRARDMEDTIHEMLANPNLKAQLYDHPVIRGLTAKKRKEPSAVAPGFFRYPIVRGPTLEKRKLPSYIPSQQFALSLFDIAMTAGTESSLIQQGIFKIRDDLEKEKPKTRDQAAIDALNILADLARSAAATEAGTAITNISLDLLKKKADEFSKLYPKYGPVIERTLTEAKVIKHELEEVSKKQRFVKSDDATLNKLREGVAALSVISPELNQSLSALLLNVEEYTTEKEKYVAKARENVEKWFNDSMDRVNGVFKRYSQGIAFVLGLIAALFLNVDSINLTLYLWRDPSVRQVLVENATAFQFPKEKFATDPEQAMQEFRNQFVGLNLPIGWVMSESGGKAFYDSNCQLFPSDHQAFGIPVFATNRCIAPPQSNNQTNIALKFLGILFTAGMTAQGAPFWFDILKKLVNLRSTGANPIEKAGSK